MVPWSVVSESPSGIARDYSVVVCTRDRSSRLARCLMSILVSMDCTPELSGELLVVDNGSTDDTASVLAAAAASDRRIRFVVEPRPGIGNARQCGVRHSTGAIILWTDDDIVVPQQWIRAMLRPIVGGEADAVAGGVAMAEGLWRPWMTGDLVARYFAHVPEPPAVAPGLVGANMALRRDIGTLIPFDPMLGTARYPGAEDVLVYVQALEAGYRVVGVSDAAVTHHFDAARLDADRLEALAAGYGRCDAYFFHHWLHAQYSLSRMRIAKQTMRLHYARVRARGNRFDERVLAARRALAFHREMRSLRGTPRRYDYRGVGLLEYKET
ncbi:glycosyltransferase family 2 protein [Microbacterium sp. ARD31]|uniref:glycosyltransferase family 2 protein n=1 Tax=Microbacterium sp. ARD31 TaxID=2962576 RepID=UPI002881E754|nr:glycosyltransferase family 2 protein [Microbacterium sp. ARD31]MDT0186470.1 glycosyltransferase family 2 protein [Microbacterium sp. ARD31]